MQFRRPVALLLAAATMHLAAVRGDAACESHGATDARAAATSSGQAHHPGEHAVPAPVPSDEEPCDDTTPTACCEALVPCSVSAVEAAESDDVALSLAPARPAYPASASLLSRIGAPDPPPPRG